MPNILLVRIDNRLVHGQVGITWTTSLGANLIVVADENYSRIFWGWNKIFHY